MIRPALLLSIATLVLIVTGASSQAKAGEHARKKMPKDENPVEVLFNSVRTVCVGRHLIDVPTGSEVVYGPAWVLVDFERHPGAASRIKSALAESLDEVEKNRYRASGMLRGPSSMLGKIVEVGPSRVLYGMGSGSAYKFEAFVPLKEDLFLLSLQSWEEGKHLDDMQKLTEVMKSLSPRSDSVVPDSPGVCVDGAFIAEGEDPRPERVTLGVRLPHFKDVHFSMAMTLKDEIVESDSLELRVKRAESAAKASGAQSWYARNRIIRKGNRNVDGWSGYEFLAWRAPQKRQGQSHEFAFTSLGEPNNPLRPTLELEMHSGVLENQPGATKPSINDAQALYLWEKIIGSIRPRAVLSPVKK